jgi:hypothetical protein
MPLVSMLRWADVDPAGRDFDPSLARAAAIEVLTEAVGGDLASNQPRAGLDRDQIERQLETALLQRYGGWIAGWNWAASEPGCGGPIHAWCCDDHSILREGEDDSDVGALQTIDRVVAAATEWHECLLELERLFGEVRNRTAHLELADRVEHAAARLVAFVVERTRAEDAWHGTFGTILGWFLESCGVEPDTDLLDSVMRGRFESWIAPSAAVIADVTRDLGGEVARQHATPSTRDALATWFAVRATAFGYVPAIARRSEPVDAHRAFIATHERGRDSQRAERMSNALDVCRSSARNAEPLTFDRLATWQAIVLGEHAPARWRTTDAFARHIRYSYSPDLPARFDAALAESNSTEPVAVRAARVYLDVAFFHPFSDGNARAARLALDHVLAREGLGLAAIEPLIMLLRSTGDSTGAYWMTAMIEQLAGPLRR